MTARVLFRFTGPGKSQLACVAKDDGWTVQSHADFLAAHGGGATASFLWDRLPYVPKPMDDYPELEAALEKVREYLKDERPVRDKIASYRSQGILADESELLGKIAELHERLVSMYLAKASKLFGVRSLAKAAEPSAAAGVTPDGDAADRPDLKNECVAMVAAIVDRALPKELTDRLSPAETRNLADEMIRNVFEPKGRLRERARRDSHKLAEMVGLAALPAVAKGRRHHIAPMLVEMLEYANLVGFEPDLGEADWPRLRARARRGIILS
jgi:hypothetical protein